MSTTPGLEDPSTTSATLGPLDNLTSHVPPEWWRTLFGPTYLMTDGDVLEAANTREETDRIVELLGLSPEDHVLDLCCGQGRHALELARRGFTEVEGLDRSEYLIGEAHKTADHKKLSATFQEGDCRDLPYADNTFDAVLLMGNSFGYFEAEQDDQVVLREVRRVLKPSGRVLLDLASGSYLRRHFEPRSWEWIDDEHFVCRERELSDDGRRLVSREVITHAEKGILADQFYAERLYGRQELSTLLAEVGFARIGFAGAHNTASERGQDMGMMARRFLVTAQAGKQHRTNGQPPPTPLRYVAVVMGDPRLPDETKRDGAFGEADFEVIDRLKEALARLDGYRFTYLDDHCTLVEEMQLLRDEVDFVFNLCDEGLRNDPRQELHVPVLLETFGLPYTGAGPQGLAHCYDKSLVRGVAREMHIPVAEACFIDAGQPVPDDLGVAFPVLVKPNAADSSIGITKDSVAYDRSELEAAVASVREKVGADQPLLIEQFLTGKDLTVSVIGNAGEYTVLPITEDDYTDLPDGLPPLCGYEAKWLPDSPYWMGEDTTVLADLPAETRDRIVTASQQLFERLGCRDYARFDWRLDEGGRPHLLEANPNPGWCCDGHMILQASYAGLDYADLLRRLLETAAQRIEVVSAG